MSEPSGTPSRYARTTQGLITSLVVSVIAVVGVYFLLSIDNGAAEQRPPSVDYLEAVDAAAGADISVVHPPALPEGWTATSVAFDGGDRPTWGLGLLTDTDTFVGVRQDADDLDDLLETYVDEEPQQGDDVLLVYGSATPDDLRTLLESLVVG